MATRADVARRAGVAPSTVSYVLSGRRTISAATRERVERAMEELDYTPDAFAQALAGSRRGMLAIHFPYYPHGLNATGFEYITAASERARQRGYHLLLWCNPIDDLKGLASLTSQRLVDGVIVMEILLDDPRMPVLKKVGLPFVTIGRPGDTEGIIYVDNDFEAMARYAIDHVADLGHRHVAYLTLPDEVINSGLGPFARTEQEIGLPAWRRGVELVRIHAANSVRAGYEAFEQLSNREPRPTAVIGFNEMATSGLLHAAAQAGVDIPTDFVVVVLGMAGPAAELLVPPVTTVAPQSAVIARTAVDALVDAVEGANSEIRQLLVPPTLTIRDSSTKPSFDGISG